MRWCFWVVTLVTVLEADTIRLFDDQDVPRRVSVCGWGRGGSGRIRRGFAKSGRESLEISSPRPLAGAVLRGRFGVVIESLPWSSSFLRFWITRAEGERGSDFNVHIACQRGDADMYFRAEFEKVEGRWVRVRLPLVKFRNFLRLRGEIRSIGFKSAGRLGSASRRFFIDDVAIEVVEEERGASVGRLELDRRVLKAGEKVVITVELEKTCAVSVVAVRKGSTEGRRLLRAEGVPAGADRLEWDGLGDELRTPWGALVNGRVERRFCPDGDYELIANFLTCEKERKVSSARVVLRLKGFGDAREIGLYHKPVGPWPHASRLRLRGGKKEPTISVELAPGGFGRLFPGAFLMRVEGLDITEEGLRVGRSSAENLALKSEVKVCAEKSPGGTWGGWKGLVDGGDACWVTPDDYPVEKPVWFEVSLPREAEIAKIMLKQTHTVQERNRIRRLVLSFGDGTKQELELPKDTACHWFYIEPPRKTKKIRGEAVEFWGMRVRGKCGLAEFQVFERAQHEQGFFETNDLMPIGLVKWRRFRALDMGSGARWEYSLNHGISWEMLPQDGKLDRIREKWGVIRFRCTLSKGAVVRGFELSWLYDPKRPIAEPLDRRKCSLSVREGAFYDRTGKRVRLFGWSYSPPWAPKGYTEEDVEGFLRAREREIASFASYGINCVRLWVPGALFLPDAERTFPDTEGYRELMLQNGYSPSFLERVDGTIELLGRYGIYTIFEFHDNPPWGYWSPIPLSGAKTHPQDYPKAFEFARPRIGKLWSWVARHFRGSPYLVGFEVPWNEPVIGVRPYDIRTSEDNLRYDSIYRSVVEECVEAIKSEDPGRLCIMGPNGWNGIRGEFEWLPPSSFWRFPKGVDAFHFHGYPQHTACRSGTLCEHYAYARFPGAPIIRTEGHCRYFFWKKLDTAPGWGYRGVDAMLAQEFATGVEVTAGWGHGGGERPLFGADFARYHSWVRFWREVVPRRKADVGIVMSSAGRHRTYDQPPHPVVEELLGLHVVPFDFIFDNCAEENADSLKRYKALVVVREGLPESAILAVKSSGVKWIEFGKGSLKEFLTECGVETDDRTPRNVLVACGDGGIVIYERGGRGGTYTIFLNLKKGSVRLYDEDTDELLYRGRTSRLRSTGLRLELEPYRARLIRVRR